MSTIELMLTLDASTSSALARTLDGCWSCANEYTTRTSIIGFDDGVAVVIGAVFFVLLVLAVVVGAMVVVVEVDDAKQRRCCR